MSESVIDIKIIAKDFASNVLKSVSGNVKTLGSRFKAGLASVLTFAKRAGIALGVVGLAAGASFVKTAGDLELAKQGFKTLLGSMEAAEKAINRIKEDAKATPFELPGLIDMNKRLISTGLSADNAADLVLSLGDAVAATGGTQAELDGLIRSMQGIANTSKFTAREVMEFGNRGVNIIGLLADSMGVSTKKIDELQSQGKIGFKEVQKALLDASAAGGKFEGAMESQATTLPGILSNIKDSFVILGTQILEDSGLFDKIKEAADRFRLFLENDGQRVIANIVEAMKAFGRTIQNIIRFVLDMRDKVRKFINDPSIQQIITFFKDQLRAATEDSKRAWKDLFIAIKPFIPLLKEFVKVGLIIAGVVIVALIGAFVLFTRAINKAFSFFSGKLRESSENLSFLKQRVGEITASIKSKFEPIVNVFNRISSAISSIIAKAGSLKASFSGLQIPSLKIPGFADGVQNFTGGLALVGERGPELVNLPRGADVFNAAQTKSLLDQGNTGEQINISNSFTSQVDPEVVASELAFQLRVR